MTTTTATAERHTVWVTNDLSCLVGDTIDVTILADEIIGYQVVGWDDDAVETPIWGSNGQQLFSAATGVRADDGDIEDALTQADDLMREAGWKRTGDWDVVATGCVAVVERV